jgi:hypothetical protein
MGRETGEKECVLCKHVYHGGALRIRQHLLQLPGIGVSKRETALETLKPVQEVMGGRPAGGALPAVEYYPHLKMDKRSRILSKKHSY